MQSALTTHASLVCLQVDRFFQETGAQVGKYFTELQDFMQCHLPVFTDSHMEIELVPYTLTAALVHVGLASGGHYRALLRLGGGAEQGGHQWLIADDDRSMELVDDLPPWTGSPLTWLWTRRADRVPLPATAFEMPTNPQPPQVGAILDLVA